MPLALGLDRSSWRPEPLVWLFSPVVGNTRWPGDIWGVDASGHLIVVEAKTYKRGTGVDPIVNFVGPGAAVAAGTSPSIQAASLRTRWFQLLKKERRFIRDYGDALRDGAPLEGCHPGVVPYSRHRTPVQRWPSLYLDKVVRDLDSVAYEERVNAYLDTRERQGNPRPHLVGLIAAQDGTVPSLSASGRRHAAALQKSSGADRVRLVIVFGKRDGQADEIRAEHHRLPNHQMNNR